MRTALIRRNFLQIENLYFFPKLGQCLYVAKLLLYSIAFTFFSLFCLESEVECSDGEVDRLRVSFAH